MVDTMAEKIFSAYEIEGINYSTMDTIFDDKVSGIGGLAEVKAHLIKNGISSHLVDKLESRYLRRISTDAHVCTIMELFQDPKSKAKFFETPLERIHLNYATRRVTHQSLFTSKVQPVKPLGVAARFFSKYYGG